MIAGRGIAVELGSYLFAGITIFLVGLFGVKAEPPILIRGIQEPDELRVEPLPGTQMVLTPPERMLAEAMQSADKGDPNALLPAVNRILTSYPEFAEGYVLRLGALCGTNDPAAILSDIDNSIKFAGASHPLKDSRVSLLSMRAKIEYATGHYDAAMTDLETAVRTDLRKATEFTNSGAVKPEKTASICVWTEPDMDALVQRFPADYRSYLFRGLYFSKFAPLDEPSVKPAFDNLDKASQLNSTSALPQYFKAALLSEHFIFYKRLNQLGWSDAGRDKLNAELVAEYDKALKLDPKLLPALQERANALLNLKQFRQAIADYDLVLSLDPMDAADWNDRGLAKLQLGDDYGAIRDSSEAIKIKVERVGLWDSSDFRYSNYENRANAYVKTRQWNSAVRDLTTAISLQLGQHVFSLMTPGDNDSTGPYTILRFEMNCKGSQIRTLALAKYNESGELVGSREGGRWESIVPDTLGEALNNAVCAVVR